MGTAGDDDEPVSSCRAAFISSSGTPSTNTCAETFAHDTAKSGGSIYDTARPLAQELETNTTDVDVTIWVPMKDWITLPPIVVMTGISDGVLVGLALFNTPNVCGYAPRRTTRRTRTGKSPAP